MEFLIFLLSALLIVIIAINFTHWMHVLRFYTCKVGKEYSSTIKGDKTKTVVTKIDGNIVWFKYKFENGNYSEEFFLDYDSFFVGVH